MVRSIFRNRSHSKDFETLGEALCIPGASAYGTDGLYLLRGTDTTSRRNSWAAATVFDMVLAVRDRRTVCTVLHGTGTERPDKG